MSLKLFHSNNHKINPQSVATATENKTLHGGDCNRKVYREDLKMFINKYKNKRSFLRKFLKLPPEIYLIKLLSENDTQNSESHLFSPKKPISDIERSLLLKMIAQNNSDREKLNKPRWRDIIIDRMVEYLEIEHKANRLVKFSDYF